MPKIKLKTHSGTKKRIHLTPGGKVMRRRAGGKHFNQKKRAGRKRVTAIKAIITGEIAKNLKRAIGA